MKNSSEYLTQLENELKTIADLKKMNIDELIRLADNSVNYDEQLDKARWISQKIYAFKKQLDGKSHY